MIPAYARALSREDVSQWLVHFSTGCAPDGTWLSPFQVVRSIVSMGSVLASRRTEVLKFVPQGATCFYDVPPTLYGSLLGTNPNGRQPYGLIVAKSVVWAKGGRPAIYADNTDLARWHPEERFRLIWTDLGRQPQPVDWTHEREWRVPGDFTLQPNLGFSWWWPCVSSTGEAHLLLSEFSHLTAIYAVETGTTISR